MIRNSLERRKVSKVFGKVVHPETSHFFDKAQSPNRSNTVTLSLSLPLFAAMIRLKFLSVSPGLQKLRLATAGRFTTLLERW